MVRAWVPVRKVGCSGGRNFGEWLVVGVMDVGRSALNSEMWGDLNQIAPEFNRENTLS